MAIGNAALLNEFDHAVEDVLAIGIEAQDEAAHHLHPIALDRGHALEQAAPRVLQLVGWRSDPTHPESRCPERRR